MSMGPRIDTESTNGRTIKNQQVVHSKQLHVRHRMEQHWMEQLHVLCDIFYVYCKNMVRFLMVRFLMVCFLIPTSALTGKPFVLKVYLFLQEYCLCSSFNLCLI